MINAGEWLMILEVAASPGDLVIARHGPTEIIAQYEGNHLVLSNGSRYHIAGWKLIGVIKPLARFVRDPFSLTDFIAQKN